MSDEIRDEWLPHIIRAIQEDIYNERMARESAFREVRKELAESYMTRDQLANTYVSRQSVILTKREKREWPVILAVVISGAVAVVDLVLKVIGQ